MTELEQGLRVRKAPQLKQPEGDKGDIVREPALDGGRRGCGKEHPAACAPALMRAT